MLVEVVMLDRISHSLLPFRTAKIENRLGCQWLMYDWMMKTNQAMESYRRISLVHVQILKTGVTLIFRTSRSTSYQDYRSYSIWSLVQI